MKDFRHASERALGVSGVTESEEHEPALSWQLLCPDPSELFQLSD